MKEFKIDNQKLFQLEETADFINHSPPVSERQPESMGCQWLPKVTPWNTPD